MNQENCLKCGQALPKEAREIANHLVKVMPWYKWAEKGEGFHTVLMDGLPVREVEVIAVSGLLNEERSHGGDIPSFMIFLVDGVFYRQIGVTDSYGSTEWDGAFMPVIPRTQAIKEWTRS